MAWLRMEQSRISIPVALHQCTLAHGGGRVRQPRHVHVFVPDVLDPCIPDPGVRRRAGSPCRRCVARGEAPSPASMAMRAVNGSQNGLIAAFVMPRSTMRCRKKVASLAAPPPGLSAPSEMMTGPPSKASASSRAWSMPGLRRRQLVAQRNQFVGELTRERLCLGSIAPRARCRRAGACPCRARRPRGSRAPRRSTARRPCPPAPWMSSTKPRAGWREVCMVMTCSRSRPSRRPAGCASPPGPRTGRRVPGRVRARRCAGIPCSRRARRPFRTMAARQVAMRIQLGAQHHAGADDLAHAHQQVAFAVVVAVGHHRAVQGQHHHVDRHRLPQVVQQFGAKPPRRPRGWWCRSAGPRRSCLPSAPSPARLPRSRAAHRGPAKKLKWSGCFPAGKYPRSLNDAHAGGHGREGVGFGGDAAAEDAHVGVVSGLGELMEAVGREHRGCEAEIRDVRRAAARCARARRTLRPSPPRSGSRSRPARRARRILAHRAKPPTRSPSATNERRPAQVRAAADGSVVAALDAVDRRARCRFPRAARPAARPGPRWPESRAAFRRRA